MFDRSAVTTRVGCVSLLCAIACLGETRYEVSGRVDVTHPRFPDSHQQFDFRVSVSTPRWNIRLVPTAHFTTAGIKPDYYEAGSDGISFFALTSIESYAARKAAEGPTKGPITVSSEAVQGPGTVPYAIHRHLSALWYAYASQEYLKDKHDGRLVPPDVYAPEVLRTNDFSVPSFWELADAPPHLPRVLVTTNYVITDHRTVLRILDASPGATNFSLRVEETHSIGGLVLPKLVDLAYNTLHPIPATPGTGGLESVIHDQVVIRGLTFSTNLSVDAFVPRLPPKSWVTDYSRLTHSPPSLPRAVRDRWFERTETNRAP